MPLEQDPLVNYELAPGIGPLSIFSMLCDQVLPAQVPYEGIWVPVKYAKAGTVELFGAITTMSLDVWGTNQKDPLNTYTLTMGGSATNNDVVSVTFTNPLLPNGAETVQFTVSTSETTTQMAAALAAAINADQNLSNLGFKATSAAAVVTVTWPSVPGNVSYGPTQSQPVIGSHTAITSSVSGGATETVTVGVGTDGQKIMTTATALAVTPLTTNLPVRFVKVRIPTLTGAGANISVGFCASA